MPRSTPFRFRAMAAALVALQAVHATNAAEPVGEIRVIGITPGAAARQALTKVPYAVQGATAAELEQAQSLDLSDFMNQRLASVSINSAQNNPLQPDLQFRGFTASPLLGLAQGLAVYQNGVRINEPLGDAVNWDLLPESAVAGMELVSGANPVFGLNTLGGALAVTMKDGFVFEGHQAAVSAGSWGRTVASAESGGNNGAWGYYVNLSRFGEDGWRDLSDSDAVNFYGTLGWRDAQRSAVDLAYQQGRSDLTGNGALPVGLLALDRSTVFTAPDITENDMQMLDFSFSHAPGASHRFGGKLFWRENTTDSFNGDASEFELCDFAGGARALFEESDDVEDALEDQLDIELDDICEGEDDDIRSVEELEQMIEEAALAAGLDPEDFEVEDVTGDLSGSGVFSDEAINNTSRRRQRSQGLEGQFETSAMVFGRTNQFITGYSWFEGESTFLSVLELAGLDPLTRSTAGLGTGTFLDTAATDIRTRSATWSWYLTNTLDLTDTLALTLSGRYNDSEVTLRDRSGERPELNGDHRFTRFNPAVGLAWNPRPTLTLYGSYSESNRNPTPIELACNEGVFELAQQYAEAAGEDPDDVEFECRLPNAFLADPPLQDVVTRSVETGVRGVWQGLRYQAGLFRAANRDDIIFQTTGRATGLFANVDKTLRQGLELAVNGSAEALDWQVAWTWLQASFEDDFMVLSPNHPAADEDGELAVERGDRIPGLPEHVLKLGADYEVLPGLRLGADVIYNSDQVLRGDEANRLDTLDGYTLVNLRARYAVRENVAVFARVSNVFDRDYENFGLLGEDPGEVLPDLADTRPLFVGVGAPRAAWIGVQLRF